MEHFLDTKKLPFSSICLHDQKLDYDSFWFLNEKKTKKTNFKPF